MTPRTWQCSDTRLQHQEADQYEDPASGVAVLTLEHRWTVMNTFFIDGVTTTDGYETGDRAGLELDNGA